MAFLTDDQLDDVAGRVFARRESTLEAEGQALPRQDLTETILRVRHRMITTIESLPPEAFEPQPVDAEGNEVWSAGQIVSHICTSQLRFTENIGQLVEYSMELDTGELDKEDMLSMTDTRETIKTATVILRQTLRAIPEDADLTQVRATERFGELSVKGWMMLAAIHEHAHVKQLKSLAGE